LREASGRILFATEKLALALKSTGLKSLWTAAAFSVSKSNPAAAKSVLA